MTLSDAKAYVARESNSAVAPVVTADEIEAILTAECKVTDEDGFKPSDSGWTASYDATLCVARVFELKASRVAQEVSFTADGAHFSLKDRREAFLELSKLWRRKRFGSYVPTAPSTDSTDGLPTF